MSRDELRPPLEGLGMPPAVGATPTPAGVAPGVGGGTSWRALVAAVALAVVGALPLALAAGMEGKLPILLAAAFLGGIGLTGLIAFSAVPVMARLLFFGLVAFSYVPFDKYLRYIEHSGGWPGLRVGAADLPLVLLVPVLALGLWLGRVRNVVPRAVLVVYGLLLAQYTLSTLGAANRTLAFYELVAAVHAIVLAVVTGAFYRRAALGPILVIMAIAVVVHAAGGATEYALGRPIGPHSAERAILEEVLAGGGSTRVRPSGLMVHPIVLADFFLLTLPALSGAALVVTGRWKRLALYGAVLAGLGMLGLTLSRGAWASTGLALIVLLLLAAREGLLDRPVRRQLYRMAVIACLGALAFAPIAIERLTRSDPGNVQVRFDLNKIALRIMAAHPIAGGGLNNFIEIMEPFDPQDVMSYFPAPVHNLYLLEGAEAGVPALVLFVAFVFTLLVAASRRLRAVRHTVDPLTRWVAAGLVASVVGLAFSQVADFSWRLEPLRTIVWMQIGLVFGMLCPDRRPVPAPANPREVP
jgi:hypothetical protein